MTDRRTVIAAAILSTPCYAILAGVAHALPVARKGVAGWINRQDELARGLKSGSVSQIEWHDGVNALAKEVDVAELAAAIRGADIKPAGAPFAHDPVKSFVHFRDQNGARQKFAFGTALFDFADGNVITPHAHRHMASAHMVIEGKVRIRTFDRVGEEAGALLLRPARDEIAIAGDAAAMTSAKDNVHWFAPKSPHAMTFDVIIDGLDAGEPDYLIQPVDPFGGVELGDGTVRAPILSFDESSRRYPASV